MFVSFKWYIHSFQCCQCFKFCFTKLHRKCCHFVWTTGIFSSIRYFLKLGELRAVLSFFKAVVYQLNQKIVCGMNLSFEVFLIKLSKWVSLSCLVLSINRKTDYHTSFSGFSFCAQLSFVFNCQPFSTSSNKPMQAHYTLPSKPKTTNNTPAHFTSGGIVWQQHCGGCSWR